MGRIAIALGFLVAGAGWAAAQDRFEETRFHRVHLRNGNVVDGTLLKKSEKEIMLRILSGDMSIRVDQIDHVEFIKMRSIIEAPPKLPIRGEQKTAERPAVVEVAAATPVVARVDQIVEEMRKVKEGERFKIAAELAQLGTDGARAATARLASVDTELRDPIVNVLLEINDRGALPELRNLLKHESADIRIKSILLIAKMGEPEYAEAVRPLLKDGNDGVRGMVLDFLRDLGSPSDIPVVAELCVEANATIRHKAIAACVRLSSKHDQKEALIRNLLTQLESSSGDAKLDIIQTLGKQGSKEFTPELVRFLREDSAEVRLTAVNALADLDAKDKETDIVSQMRQESDTKARMSFAVAAQRLQLRSAIPVIIEWLDDANSELRTGAVSSLKAITSQDFGQDRARWAAWWDQNNK